VSGSLSRKKHTWLVLLLGGIFTCSESEQPSTKQELPLNRDATRSSEDHMQQLAGSRRWCETVQHRFEIGEPSNLVAIGQLRRVMKIIDAGDIARAEPIALYALVGYGPADVQQVEVWSVSTKRETNRVRLLLQGPDMKIIEVVYERPMTEKDIDYISVTWYRVEYLPWEDYVEAVEGQEQATSPVIVDIGDPIYFPSDREVEVCVAVEDRDGRVSNYVPVVHYDYPVLEAKPERSKE
jgi:hypothetical protein